MDLERELRRVLHEVEVEPASDPVADVHAGIRRRRRVRRVQAATAALAVAAVAVGVSTLLVGQEPRTRTTPLPGTSISAAPTTQPTATSAPTGTPSPEPSASAAPPVLTGAVAADLSWVSLTDGFALSSVTCGSTTCSRLLRTTDGGRTWSDLHATGLPSACSTACPLRVRFADATTGYVYGDGLVMTTDGGRSWSPQPEPDTHGLEIAHGIVLRVVERSACPGCAFDVQRSTVGSTTWQQVYRSDEGVSAADLTRQGDDVAVTLRRNPAGGANNAQSTLLLSQDAGATWTRHEDPCGGTGPDEVDVAWVGWSQKGELAVLCQRRMWRSNGGNSTVLLSDDAGRTFSRAAGFPEATDARLLADGDGVLLAETHQGNDTSVALQRSTDGGRTWTEVERAPLPDGDSTGYLAFSTNQVVTWAPPGGGQVLRSSDAGLTWTTYQLG